MKYEKPDSNSGCSHTRRRWASGAASSKNTDPRERAVARCPRHRGEQMDGVLSASSKKSGGTVGGFGWMVCSRSGERVDSRKRTVG